MPSTTVHDTRAALEAQTETAFEVKRGDVRDMNKEGRVQPWKTFVTSGADSDSEGDREADFITIRNKTGADGEDVHDYTAQLG